MPIFALEIDYSPSLTAIGVFVGSLFNALGIIYAVLRKESRRDKEADLKSDQTLAGAYRKTLAEALDRHAKEYAQFTNEREHWRKEQAEFRAEIDGLREENVECRETTAQQGERIKWLEGERETQGKRIEWLETSQREGPAGSKSHDVPTELRDRPDRK